MKPSHIQTPRTMRDGVWYSGSTSEPYRSDRAGYMAVNIMSALAFIFVVGLLVWEAVK